MKPVKAGHIKITREITAVSEEILTRRGAIDEVGEVYIEQDFANGKHGSVFDEIRKLPAPTGFSWTGRFWRLMDQDHFMYGRGSVFPHEDYGFGITALTLLHATESECVLIASGKTLLLREGDIALFESSEEHAWISNGEWVLAAMPAKRTRPKRSAVTPSA
jgi:hypothetical protein